MLPSTVGVPAIAPTGGRHTAHMTAANSSRYGRAPMTPQRRRRLATVAGVVVALVLVGGAVAAFQRSEGTEVEGKMAAYQVLDDQTVAVTIRVTRKDPALPVVCIVRARSRDGAETGRREFLVEPSQSKTVHVTAEVKSYQRPLVGDIYGCGSKIPPYLQRIG